MPLFLTERDRTSKEKMDDPDCDLKLLNNTYSQFSNVNRLLGGWSRIYKKWLLPVLSRSDVQSKVLDIGCGGGDVLRSLKKLTDKDNLNVQFTGIDPDPRAIQFAKNKHENDSMRFLKISSEKLVESGRLLISLFQITSCIIWQKKNCYQFARTQVNWHAGWCFLMTLNEVISGMRHFG